MAGDERSRPETGRERRATRRRFLKAFGAAAGAHFVLLNDWVFAAAPKRPRTVEEDIMCNRTGNWPKTSAVFEDRDCGKPLPGGTGVFTDQDCGRQSPHVYPGNATWDDADCGKPDATGKIQKDSCCGLSAAGMGGAHWDNDCGKPASPGSGVANTDQDCNLPTKGLGRYKDGDCGKPVNPQGGTHTDSFCRFWF